MQIGSNIKKASFLSCLKQGMVFRLKGNKPFVSEDYHVFVVLNYDPKTGDVLFLVNGTSQLEKVWNNLERNKEINAEDTTVFFKKKSYSFFSKDTIINCNSVAHLHIDDINFDDGTIKFISGELSQEDIERILLAVEASPIVEKDIKEKMRR